MLLDPPRAAHPPRGSLVAAAAPAPAPKIILPPARRARIIAVVLSALAVLFMLGFGVVGRKAYALHPSSPDDALVLCLGALVLLLVALLLRMGGAVCELIWLERTWSNLPESLRKVGPVRAVGSGLLIGVSFVPGVAWLWKLGLIVAVADGFEAIRPQTGFRAPIPKRLGMAAAVVGWVPGLNVYIAPFLWEMFARRIDLAVGEIMASHAP